ncbi:MAG: cytochrome C oxidase Cbb3 [Planctomycetes bacterium]|nr:cytochrome C oxidase Cbb3 [Planctomycetota bacterium]
MTDTPASAPQNDPAEEYLTDHSYDGIQEYDNPLPGWWKALFWGSIGFSVLYWAWYQAGPGKGVFERYEASVVAAEEAKAERQRERLAGMELKPDAATLSALMANEEFMASQERVWQLRCAACHWADGRGVTGLGPNMTDDAYIHVKTLEDFPRIVENGIPGKAMTPFKGILSEEEIIQIAAYAAYLRGTEVDPAAGGPVLEAQGEVIPAWPAAEAGE